MEQRNRRGAPPAKRGEAPNGSPKTGFGLSDLAMAQGVRLEFLGNRELMIDGCKGVLDYDMDEIRVNAPKMIIKVNGRCLTIKCMTRDSMTITGFISGVCFIT